jgi:hypothetical protein
LTRFYGVSPTELATWPGWLIDLYYDAMERLAAEDTAQAIMTSSYPNMTEEAQKNIGRDLQRVLGRGGGERVNPVSEEGKSALGGIGIKVVVGDA